jgi:hypothetical protein
VASSMKSVTAIQKVQVLALSRQPPASTGRWTDCPWSGDLPEIFRTFGYSSFRPARCVRQLPPYLSARFLLWSRSSATHRPSAAPLLTPRWHLPADSRVQGQAVQSSLVSEARVRVTLCGSVREASSRRLPVDLCVVEATSSGADAIRPYTLAQKIDKSYDNSARRRYRQTC